MKHNEMMMGGNPDLRFQEDQGESTLDLAFSIRDHGTVFTDFGVSHTKEMHLIVVRDDLQYFQHLHPERDKRGIWHVDFQPKAGGTHWLYADFVDSAGDVYILREEKSYVGDIGRHGIAQNTQTVKSFDGYRVEFTPTVEDGDLILRYTIIDQEENPVRLQTYLGAKGHSVLISPSGDFIHTHMEEGDEPVFRTPLPKDAFYRVFTQFQIEGTVITTDFDWQIPS